MHHAHASILILRAVVYCANSVTILVRERALYCVGMKFATFVEHGTSGCSETVRCHRANERPEEMIEDDTLALRKEPLPDLEDGQLLFRTLYLSLDATNRVWLSDWDIYMEPVSIGEPMRGFVFGEIVESKNPDFPVGAHAAGLHSWSDYIVTDGAGLSVLPSLDGIDLAEAFAILSVAGPTAYVGLHDIGKLKTGDTVVVSGAAGAVGTMVGQIAKNEGCKVIGIAGAMTNVRC